VIAAFIERYNRGWLLERHSGYPNRWLDHRAQSG